MIWILIFLILIFLFFSFLWKEKKILPPTFTKEGMVPLSLLSENQVAVIEELTSELESVSRHRLLDLGFVQGSKVKVHLSSPMHDPRAYFIHNSVVALRNAQAQHILVKIVDDERKIV